MANETNVSMVQVTMPMIKPTGCVVSEHNSVEEMFKKFFANRSEMKFLKEEADTYEGATVYLQYVTVILCVLGIVGNILNILVLSQKGLLVSMERMERSAHCGLLALALSDLLFCATTLPNPWVHHSHEATSNKYALYYAIYSDGITNTFLLSSTWLTVTMATSRYLAICFPLRARQVIGMTFAKTSIIVVFIVCILFNIPKYFSFTIEESEYRCETVYNKMDGPLLKNPMFAASYRWTYFVVGILIPLLVLIFCNINLVRALQHSVRMQASLRATRTRAVNTTNRITLIFIIIILLYLLMVVPGEVIHFVRDMATKDQVHFSYNLALYFTNMCQAINFAFNFVLYLTVNTHFRSQFCMLVRCAYLRGKADYGHHGRPVGTSHTPSYSRQMELSTTEHLLDGSTTMSPSNGLRPSINLNTSFPNMEDSRLSSEGQSPMKNGSKQVH